MTLKRILGAMALLLTPAIAFAHPGHGDNGLIAGISHPIGGLDHLLAMLAVGLWAAQQQGAARWALPCTFVGTMLIGGLLGFEGLEPAGTGKRDCRLGVGAGSGGCPGGASTIERGGWRDGVVCAVPWRGPWPGIAGHVESLGVCRWICCGDGGVACGGLCAGAGVAASCCAVGSTGGCGFGGDRGVVVGRLIL